MLKNYLKIGWGNLAKNKGYALVNISVLSIGMAVALLIGLWVWGQINFNFYHKNYDLLTLVWQHNEYNGITRFLIGEVY